MKRNHFIKGLAIGTITLPVALKLLTGKTLAQQNSNAKGLSTKTYNWKMVTTWPPNFPIIGEGMNHFAEMVRIMSGSRMNIKVYGGGELVPALETFDAVRSGAAEFGSGAGYYWAGKVPAAQFFSTVPFGMNAQQMNAWLLNGEGWDLWKTLYANYNLIPFPCGNTGVQMGGWFNEEINSIADFKGLKMRIPGLGGKVFERVGGTPVLLAGGEIYTGLERGVIDATEWLSPFHDYIMGFHQIAKYYYTPGWHEPGTALELIVNKEKYEELPDDLKEIIRAAALTINHWLFSEMEMKNSEYLSIIQKESNVQFRRFPEDVMATLRKNTAEVINEIIAKDEFTKKVYDSLSAFQSRASTWSKYSEKVFYNSIEL